ncbi:10540_t:CDS:1, partial [Cetraspora pellucida]
MSENLNSSTNIPKEYSNKDNLNNQIYTKNESDQNELSSELEYNME